MNTSSEIVGKVNAIGEPAPIIPAISPCPPFESGQDDEFTFPEEPVFADIEEHLEKAFAQASACRRAEGSP